MALENSGGQKRERNGDDCLEGVLENKQNVLYSCESTLFTATCIISIACPVNVSTGGIQFISLYSPLKQGISLSKLICLLSSFVSDNFS